MIANDVTVAMFSLFFSTDSSLDVQLLLLVQVLLLSYLLSI